MFCSVTVSHLLVSSPDAHYLHNFIYFFDSPVYQFSPDASLEEPRASIAGQYSIMFSTAGVTTDNAWQSKTAEMIFTVNSSTAVARIASTFKFSFLTLIHVKLFLRIVKICWPRQKLWLRRKREESWRRRMFL